MPETDNSVHSGLETTRSSVKNSAHRFDIELAMFSMLPFAVLILVMIALAFSSPADILSVSIRLILGAIGLILVPGFSVVRLFMRNSSVMEVFGFSLILGIGIQMVSVLSLFSVVTVFFYQQVDFSAVMSFMISILVFTCCVIRIRKESSLNSYGQSATGTPTVQRRNVLFKLKDPILALFAVALILRIFLQVLSVGPGTDGSNYLETARNIVQNGIFYSNAVEAGTEFELMFSMGFIPHVGTSFVLAVFFEIGGVSYSVGKMAVVFFGSILVFPVYGIAKELFNTRVALISGIIVAIHPFLLEYSVMLYGPEIMAAVFLTSSFYFLLLSTRESRTWQSVFAGIFAFLTFIVWSTDFYIYFLVIPLLILFRSREIHRGDIFLVFLLVGYWIFTSQFSANIPLGLAFHIGAPALLLSAIFLKKERWIRSLSLFLLTVSVLLEFYWIRSFVFSEVFIAPASSVASSTVIENTIGRFIPSGGILELLNNVFYYLAPGYINNVSLILVVLGLASLVLLKGSRRNSLLLLFFPIFQLILYAASLSKEMLEGLIGWENRLLLAATPFFIVLAAAFIDGVMIWLRSRIIRVRPVLGKRQLSTIASTFVIALIILPPVFASFYSQYYGVADHVKAADIKTAFDLGPAVNWINQYTALNDTIATRKPYEWAWYTGRRSVMFDQSTDLAELLALIQHYKVEFVIVDTLFYGSYKNLKNLYTNPETPPAGFRLVFESQNADGKDVLIYNTSSVINSDVWFGMVPIEDFENLTGWVVDNGKISLDNVSRAEGNASLKLETVPYPSPQDQFTAEIIKDRIFPDISNVTSFSLWVKANTTVQNKILLQFFDDDLNWRTYSISYSDVGSWENITIPMGSFSSQSPTPINQRNINAIVLRIQEMPMPSAVWFDQLSFTLIK